MGTGNGFIYALNAASGAMYWRAYAGASSEKDNLTDHRIVNPIATYRNLVFASVFGGLYAFDLLDGSSRWRYIPVKEDDNTISPPIVSDGLVLVAATDNHVYALNP